jgi:CRISPR-associated protein Cas2
MTLATYGGVKTVWILVLFDLPTDTKTARRQYTQFRKFLLDDSYTMMQYSVYMRHCASDENATVHINRVKYGLPPEGEVRILTITDQQFAKIDVYYGKKRQPIEQAPTQLEFL